MDDLVYSIGNFYGALFASIALIVLVLCIYSLILPRKSKQYTALLSDMYVAGIIKQLAEKDKVDLYKELLEFNRIDKRSKLSEKGLNQVVEDELKEKIAKVEEDNLDKKVK